MMHAERTTLAANAGGVAAELISRGQPIVSGTLNSCVDQWLIMSEKTRAAVAIRLERPIRIGLADETLLTPQMIAELHEERTRP